MTEAMPNTEAGAGAAGLPAALSSAAAAAMAADRQLPVLSNRWVNGEYKHLVLRADAPLTLAQPGQFFHLLCPSNGATALTAQAMPFFRRPMSCYRADPANGQLEFLYKVAGSGTRALAGLQAGDSLTVFGPLGRGFRLDPAWRHIVVLGRGVGLATLAPLAEAAAAQHISVTAILSARNADLVMSAERFAASHARVVTVLDSDGSSMPARVGLLLEALVAAGQADAFFTCGSARLLHLLQQIGSRHGIPGQVALEQQMACGLGMCFCCVRPIRKTGGVEQSRVCCDGPVFGLHEAIA